LELPVLEELNESCPPKRIEPLENWADAKKEKDRKMARVSRILFMSLLLIE
jgi:hypothetical protein